MTIRHIKAPYSLIAALALFSIGANQQVHAIGFANQQATTGNKVHLAAAALSGPVSMAAIAYPDSRFLGCAEHVLKAIDEFMAIAQYHEFHPSLIGWFCYDVYHAFTSLQGPAIEPVGDADLANQLATFEADNTDTKQQIVLSDGQRSSIKQFIRYILAGAEASTRFVAACNNEQATTIAHKNYLWDSRGLLHSLTSLSRLANYYLETENDDLKAVLLVLIIINTVGSVCYYTDTYNTRTAYTTEQRTHHPLAQGNGTQSVVSATPSVATNDVATSNQTQKNNSNHNTENVAQATLSMTQANPKPRPVTITPTTAIDPTSINLNTGWPTTATLQSSLSAPAPTINRLNPTIARTDMSADNIKQSKLEVQQPSPLDEIKAHRPLGSQQPAFYHHEFKTAVLAFLQAYHQDPTPYKQADGGFAGFMSDFSAFCRNANIEPFIPPTGYPYDLYTLLFIDYSTDTKCPMQLRASSTPEQVNQFCQSFQTYCEQRAPFVRANLGFDLKPHQRDIPSTKPPQIQQPRHAIPDIDDAIFKTAYKRYWQTGFFRNCNFEQFCQRFNYQPFVTATPHPAFLQLSEFEFGNLIGKEGSDEEFDLFCEGFEAHYQRGKLKEARESQTHKS